MQLDNTAIFLTNGFCIIVDCSLLQFLTLVSQDLGQKSYIITKHRLWASVTLWQPYSSTQQPKAIEVHKGKGQLKVPCSCLSGGHIQSHYGVLTTEHSCEGGTIRSTSRIMHTSTSVLLEYLVLYS